MTDGLQILPSPFIKSVKTDNIWLKRPLVWRYAWLVHHLSFFSKAVVVLEVRLGLLSCWKPALWNSFQRDGDYALLQNVTVLVGFHDSLNKLWFPTASRTHAAPNHDT
ncbi:hypothetical protein XENORESO_006464 [Xenotaenia resolanae]|uniref:Uncharacterized protein n=1 Tax=Xenotaenia resolanae TaxID=208358 RepID=A0ABV0WKF2_9TELE